MTEEKSQENVRNCVTRVNAVSQRREEGVISNLAVRKNVKQKM